MKNIITAALMAALTLSLGACGDKSKKQTTDSTSTTTVIDSSTKTTSVVDSTKVDTAKVAEHKTPGKRSDGASGATSLQAVKDSFKKDSAKMSRK